MMLWLVLTSTVAGTEVVTGAVVSVLAATIGFAVARRDHYEVRAPAAWLRWFVALPRRVVVDTALLARALVRQDRKSTRLNSSHPSISYAVFCLKKKKIQV